MYQYGRDIYATGDLVVIGAEWRQFSRTSTTSESIAHTTVHYCCFMAEAIGIAAGIGSILKAIASTGIYLNGTVGASREAQEIASLVHATEAILKSLKASLKTIHRSNDFYGIWANSTNLVLRNVKVTIDDLNNKLGSQRGTARLNFWAKVKWPLAREDSLLLQQHLQAYMQMLSIVQNAYMQ